MFVILNRLAWILSLTLGAFIGFLFADLDSSMYSSWGENFFEWGWIPALICGFLIKKFFLSENTIEEALKGSYTPSPSSEMIAPSDRGTPTVDSSLHDLDIEPEVDKKSEEQNIYAWFSDPQPSTTLHQEEKVEEVKKPNWLVVFFSDRPLAKIGGILLFLGALFFLSLIWTVIGAVGKIVIWLIFGLSLYGLWVWMDRKWQKIESRTLLGVGIAINTLTILSGRWIIDADSSTSAILSDSITLIFLLLNTLLAVVTGLVYTSRTFLIFSFVFAYIIPFLVGSSSSSAVLMILYVALISFGGYALFALLSKKGTSLDDAAWLIRTVLVWQSILFIVSGLWLDTSSELGVFLIMIFLLTGTSLWLLRKYPQKSSLTEYIILATYIILGSALIGMGGRDGTVLYYIIALVPLAVYTGFQIIALGATMMLSVLLLIPLVFGLFLFVVFGMGHIALILVPILVLYGWLSVFFVSYFSIFFRYIFFFFIALFLSVFSIAIDFAPLHVFSSERSIITLAVLAFFLLSLWSALRHRIISLAVMSTISSAIILALLLLPSWHFSWGVYGFFLMCALFFPFFTSKNTTSFGPVSFVVYEVVIFLFLLGELFFLGNDIWFTDSSSSLITLGLIVFGISIGALGYIFLLMRYVLDIDFASVSTRSLHEKNLLAALFAIPLSLFSLSIAIVFSENALVVATVWILESTILAYFAGRTKSAHILNGSLVLLIIGLLRIVPYFDTISPRDWYALVPLSIIALSLAIGVRSFPREPGMFWHFIYDIVHIVGISLVGWACIYIVPHSAFGWSILAMAIFIALSAWWYRSIQSFIISSWMLLISIVYFFYHMARVESLELSLASVIVQLWALWIAWYATWHRGWSLWLQKIAFIFASIMVLVITSLYVNEITDNVFMVTIYLTFVSTCFILRWIQKDIPKLRTVGLYIGVFVLIKILFYDLWIGVDNLIVRVLALMISGGVMIWLSQLYGRYVNRSWSLEFSFDNFSSAESSQDQDPKKWLSPDDSMPFSDEIIQKIKFIDVSDIDTVALVSLSGERIFESHQVWIMRLTRALVQGFHKDQFVPHELDASYALLIPQIRSTLPKKDLDSILEKINTWVVSGGSIVFTAKK